MPFRDDASPANAAMTGRSMVNVLGPAVGSSTAVACGRAWLVFEG